MIQLKAYSTNKNLSCSIILRVFYSADGQDTKQPPLV